MDYQWDEAFLGLLSAAVWKLAGVRRPLVGAFAVTRQGLEAGAGSAAALMSSSAQVTSTTAPAAAVAVVAIGAVLRRLYHPKPSVRRMAGSIAVRLAFDGPSFFSPLALVGGIIRGVDLEESDAGGGGGGRVVSLGDGFELPGMVVQAYPRLMELVVDSGSRGGVGGGGSRSVAAALMRE